MRKAEIASRRDLLQKSGQIVAICAQNLQALFRTENGWFHPHTGCIWWRPFPDPSRTDHLGPQKLAETNAGQAPKNWARRGPTKSGGIIRIFARNLQVRFGTAKCLIPPLHGGFFCTGFRIVPGRSIRVPTMTESNADWHPKLGSPGDPENLGR